MKKNNTTLRAVAAVVLLALIVMAIVFLMTGNFNIFTKVACLSIGLLLFVEMSLVCSLV